MEESVKVVSGYIALGVETAAGILILIGAAQAFYEMLRRAITGRFVHGTRREVLVQFGVWLLLGLEFELAADIIRSAISPTWNAIGQLAAIATIRTVLNYFLKKDIEEFAEAPDANAQPSTRLAA